MKLAFTHGHRNGDTEWEKRELFEWLTDAFEAPAIVLKPGCTNAIRKHVADELKKARWRPSAKVDDDLNLTVFAKKGDLAIQLQTGNMSRAPYDLLKLQHLYHSGKIEAAALALPTKEAAGRMGSNIANAERVCKELAVFDRVIDVPILLIAFE